MKKNLLMAAVAMMTAINIHAQIPAKGITRRLMSQKRN